MGIEFLNCDASWSYTGFTRFKSRLPARIPLASIFQGSDVKGEYSVEDCKKMLPILKETLAEWKTRETPEDPEEAEDWLFDRYGLGELVKGMMWAVENKKPLKYG